MRFTLKDMLYIIAIIACIIQTAITRYEVQSFQSKVYPLELAAKNESVQSRNIGSIELRVTTLETRRKD